MQLASSWSAVWPPVTLAVMARLAENLGHVVEIFDANVQPLKFEDVPGILSGVDVLVLNTSFPTIGSDFDVAGRAKKLFPEITVISFGVFFTLLEETGFPRNGCIDYAIVGEPEETFRELLAALENGNVAEIPGLMRGDGNGGVCKENTRDFIEDLDALPLPDRGLLHNDRYVLPHNGEPFTLINSSRGCPFPCTFCVVAPYYGRKVRRRSAESVLEEITSCVVDHGIRNFLMWEEAFTLDRHAVREFCKEIMKRKLDIGWAVTTRGDSLDAETLGSMKRAGCFLIGMGIESSSQDILDRARKSERLSDIEEGIRLCNRTGIPVMGHFIFGLPGETPETARSTVRYMKSIGLTYVQCYCAVPYPKTEFGERAEREGWVTTKDWSKYDFGGDSIVDMPDMPAMEVSGCRRRAFRAFYLRPTKILAEALKLRTPGGFRRAASFLKWFR